MIEALKVIIILVILAIMAYPLLPFKSKAKKFSTFYALRYETPNNKKNFPFVLLTIVEFIVVAILFSIIFSISNFIDGIPFISSILSKIGSKLKFDATVLVGIVLVNLLILYSFVFLKGLLKAIVFDNVWGLKGDRRKKKKKKKHSGEADDAEAGDEETAEGTGESAEGEEGSPTFLHTDEGETADEEKSTVVKEDTFLDRLSKFLGKPFFHGENQQYARPWVMRVTSVLQTFIYVVEIVYFVFFALLLLAIFFPMPSVFYNILAAIVPNFFLYPFITLIFLQEICNTLTADVETVTVETEDIAEEEKKRVEERKIALKKLHAKLIRDYSETHKIRYYEVTTAKNIPPYKATNKTYEKALEFIRKNMNDTSGHVIESYMRGVDSLLNNNNVYFGASFYSELGEYLIAYTYVRLLSGERMIFVVSSKEEVESLKKFIGRRLDELSGCSTKAAWRIRDGSERLDQADILIAMPEDFSNDNIVESYPIFFQNVCNAMFIEADKIVNLDSYLCTIIANRLRNASDGEICFVFLTTHICQGLVKSLKKFFKTTKDIVECNNADENENVTFMLWNCECDQIYERNGLRVETPEMLIATAAYEAEVDGIKILSQSPLSVEKTVTLRSHRVEINEMKKEIPEVNYMICVDEQFNLASAIYAYTRFRGKLASMVHILSKPYLLREYFASTAKEYVNRSTFIKPRVTEHADEQKLLLLDLFCDATRNAEGMKLSEFSERVKSIIKGYASEDLYKEYEKHAFPCEDLVGYMLDVMRGEEPRSPGDQRTKSYKRYYRLTNSKEDRGYLLKETSYITFLFVEEIFSALLACNSRVELWLNGDLLGRLDAFPTRLCQQYVPGQSIVYRNCEYEIEKISDDNRRIYLRQENVTFKNCLDTVFLRRYDIKKETAAKTFSGVMHYTRGILETVTVSMLTADVTGETYGFYNLMSDTQTLDFTKTVVGNPHLEDAVIGKVRRILTGVPVMSIKISSREEVNDGMRRLLSTVLNEFIRTMFPVAYRCIAVVPVLEQPFDPANFENDFDREVAGLYPYLRSRANDGGTATPNLIELLVINDCSEDVGVLDMIYDGAARIVEELLSYAYSYLKWLTDTPELSCGQKHYIYFGGEGIPAVYDLDKTVALLENCARDFVRTDISTAVAEETEDDDIEEKRCAFCHSLIEEGRYSRFSRHRYICISCEAKTTTEQADIDRIEKAVRKYMAKKYPSVELPKDIKIKQDKVYTLTPGSELNEFYYKTDTDARTVLVEKDNPEANVAVSIIHNLIFFWQYDRKYWVSDRYRIANYLTAQMYYEEFEYLRSHDRTDSIDWIKAHIDPQVCDCIDELEKYLAENEGKTAFDFVEEKVKNDQATDHGENSGSSELLFDPDRVPRFWKRFLYDDPDSMQQDDDAVNTLTDDDDGDDIFDELDGEGEGGADEGEGDDQVTEEDISGAELEEHFSPRLMAPPPLGDEEDTAADAEVDPLEDGEVDDTAEDGDAETDIEADATEITPEESPKERKKREKQEEKERKAREKQEKKAKKEEEKRRKKLERELARQNKKKRKKGEDEEATSSDIPAEDDEDLTPATPEDIDAEGGDTEGGDTDGTAAENDDAEAGEDEGAEASGKGKKSKKNKKKPDGKKLIDRIRKIKTGEELVPFEEEEKTNPKIRFYNAIVRHAFDYKLDDVEIPEGLSRDDVRKIQTYVLYDYPEIFWIKGWYTRGDRAFGWCYRFMKPDGTLDVALIKRYRKEIRASVGYFTKGITRRTSPYKALLTIYRRVILAFDYDMTGLNKEKKGLTDNNQEDELRSLHSALVKRKVVCAGYAVAMQYLLQSVGICCAQITSETHAWNVVEIGGNVYHLDATWGDIIGDEYRDKVFYDYFCITSEENARGGHVRMPEEEYYGGISNFTAQKHEYFRYHNAYLTRYDENKLATILADGALRKEPCIGVRCANKTIYDSMIDRLSNGRFSVVVNNAKELIAAKNKRLAKKFSPSLRPWKESKQFTLYFFDYLK